MLGIAAATGQLAGEDDPVDRHDMRRWIAMFSLALCAGCAAEVASHARSTSADPVVGRLKTRNGTIDLTVGSFAPERDGVPREAMASEVMADIDVGRRPANADETRGPRSR